MSSTQITLIVLAALLAIVGLLADLLGPEVAPYRRAIFTFASLFVLLIVLFAIVGESESAEAQRVRDSCDSARHDESLELLKKVADRFEKSNTTKLEREYPLGYCIAFSDGSQTEHRNRLQDKVEFDWQAFGIVIRGETVSVSLPNIFIPEYNLSITSSKHAGTLEQLDRSMIVSSPQLTIEIRAFDEPSGPIAIAVGLRGG